jgi:hypothetical protein
MRESADVMHNALPILATLPVMVGEDPPSTAPGKRVHTALSILAPLPVVVGEGPPSKAPGRRVRQGQGGAAMFASAEQHSHG